MVNEFSAIELLNGYKTAELNELYYRHMRNRYHNQMKAGRFLLLISLLGLTVQNSLGVALILLLPAILAMFLIGEGTERVETASILAVQWTILTGKFRAATVFGQQDGLAELMRESDSLHQSEPMWTVDTKLIKELQVEVERRHGN